MISKTPMPWSIAPYFIVNDVVVTANFYRDKLGFHYERFWGEPPCFCVVKRGGIVITSCSASLPLRDRSAPTGLSIPTAAENLRPELIPRISGTPH